jgi:DNA-binding transcriptional regulator YiaG
MRPKQITGKQIQAWRAAYDVSQKELATILRVTPRTISRWESGAQPPPYFLRFALDHLGDLKKRLSAA